MADPRFDVLGIGNAIVDVIARAEEDFLVAEKMAKGTMRLIDAEQAESLYERMGPGTEISGGSAGNTIAGIASLGGKAAFIGKTADDELGRIFAHDLRAMGVHYPTAPLGEGAPTARCLVFVTPDGERTMNTFLGAAQSLAPEDIDADTVKASAITYLEGYLWDPPAAKEAFRRAADLAHEAGRRVALTLSDPFCVDRFRDEFVNLLRGGTVDIVFANAHEARSLYETSSLESAIAALREDCPLAVVTRSEEGAVVVTRESTQEVASHPVDRVVDATGAGDLFAAGFLYALARGRDHVACARLGAMAAAEVISHVGARPQVDLKSLAAENGLLAEAA